jgi:hypothetical protein
MIPGQNKDAIRVVELHASDQLKQCAGLWTPINQIAQKDHTSLASSALARVGLELFGEGDEQIQPSVNISNGIYPLAVRGGRQVPAIPKKRREP